MAKSPMHLNHRCGICNRVSSREIETNVDEYTSKAFVPDPKNRNHFICEDCKSDIEEQLHFFDIDDFREKMIKKAANNNDDGEIPLLEDEW